jgi:hypothetical protein
MPITERIVSLLKMKKDRIMSGSADICLRKVLLKLLSVPLALGLN